MTPRSHRKPTAIAGMLLALAGCQTAAPPPQSPVQSEMYRHFALARDMRTFAVTGETDLLRATALELAEAEETWGLPPGTARFAAAVHEGARRAAEAETHGAAVRATAELAASCGACHLANDVALGSRFRVAEPLVNGNTARHMNHLAWASRLLWDGLVGPSELTWRTGAEAMAGTGAFPTPTSQHVPQEELDRAQARLNELGAQALSAEEPSHRVRVLADVWTLCSDCHAQAGVR